MQKKILIFAIFAVIAQIVAPIVVQLIYPSLQNRALFGDSFGITSSIFSLFAILAVLYTIAIQRSEIQKNERSSDEQLKHMQRQTDSLEKTTKLNALATMLNVTDSKLKYLQSDQYIEKLNGEGLQEKQIISKKEQKVKEAKSVRDKYQDELDDIFKSI
jgi:hypothetical protein